MVNKEAACPVSLNRIDRRMKDLGIVGYHPKPYRTTTIPDPLLKDSPNLVKGLKVTKKNQVWVSDISYVKTQSGWLYLCVILDVFSRKILGWKLDIHMKSSIVVEALKNAIETRKPEQGLIFHSDKGGQYKSKRLRRMLKRKGFRQSMTGIDHCYDNAFAESFFATLKKDLIRGKAFLVLT